MGTLTPHIRRYLTGRRQRGELTPAAARNAGYQLAHLDRVHGARPVARLGPAVIDRWLDSISHQAPSTRRGSLSTVRGFARWLVAQGHVRTDPTAHVHPIRQPRRAVVTVAPAEVAAVLAAAPDARARAVVWLMVGCGLRCVEVSRLEVHDWDPRARTVRVAGKGGHQRVIPVPVEVGEALDAHLDECGRVGGPMFRSQRGGRLAPRTVSDYVARWMEDAGVRRGPHDGRTAHGLRRTAASDVMDACGDITVVQEMLGHAQVSTTAAHYLRPVSVERMRTAMEGREYGQAA